MGKSARTLKSIFAHAFAIDSPEARERYLADACQGDSGMLGEVESLFQAFDGTGLSEESHVFSSFSGEECQSALAPSEVIDQYKLLEEIGEGGMGVVYMAEQTEPIRRKVALKIIKPGMDSRQVIARFEAERQALAMMDHPNIARVFDAGSTGKGPALFRHGAGQGNPITEYCDRSRLHPATGSSCLIAGLPGDPACPSKGHYPPRYQAVERAGFDLRWQGRCPR